MLKKKYKIIFILFISLLIFTACDNTEESIIKEQKYLSLALNNDYSVKSLTPGQGRYSYDQNSVAEISFELNEGYEFDSLEGEGNFKPTPTNKEYTYQLKMNQDRQLTLKTILNQFKLLNIGLSDNKEDYASGMKIENLPYNLEEMRLVFNNKVNQDNELEFEITDPNSDSDGAIFSSGDYSNDIFTIEENRILLNWENFNPVETEELSFGSEYQLIVSEEGFEDNNYIFDSNLNELNSDVKLNFIIEEAKPEKVENLVLKTEDQKLELSWLRSEVNKDYQNESYVSQYRIYEFKNQSEFTKENADNKFIMDLDEPNKDDRIEFEANQDKKIKRVIIHSKDEFNNLDLENNTYHYRVTAFNSAGNESELSEVVSTD